MEFLSLRCVMVLLILLAFYSTTPAQGFLRHLMANNDTHQEGVAKMLQLLGFSNSDSHIIFTDGNSREYQLLASELILGKVFQGVALFNTMADAASNGTLVNILTTSARKVRMASLGINIVVLSDETAFLKEFAISCTENRLLSGITKLVVIGRLDHGSIQDLTSYWTISVMNTLLMIPKTKGLSERWDVLAFMPFTPSGSRLVRLASLSLSKGLVKQSSLQPFFPQKFSNMYGGSINISALPYEPYWREDRAKDGSVTYSGSDRLMLEAIASTLNFSINLLPVKTWDEVFQSVANRSSWVAPIIHFVLPSRLKYTDFAWNYENDANLAFVMVKPSLEPKWQSLYYPLTYQVWILIIATIAVVAWSLIALIRVSRTESTMMKIGPGFIVLGVFGTLLGQGLSDRHFVRASVRILLTFWLIFAFVIGNVYKGNLVAFLVAPRYPPRPETPEELVTDVKRVTMPPFGHNFRDSLLASEIESLRALGNMMQVGTDFEEGLQMTLKYRYPHIDSLRFLQHQIALHHTKADGSSLFYIGREGVMAGLYAWPIPHDAPFKQNFDSVILTLQEGGFYDKWIHNWLEDAKKLGRQKNLLEMMKDQLQQGNTDSKFPITISNDADELKSLTIVHFQGPLLILGIGVYLAAIIFLMEYFDLPKLCLKLGSIWS